MEMRNDEVSVVHVDIDSRRTTNLRFAANQMSTAGSAIDCQIAITSSFGSRHAVVTTNDPSDESQQRLVSQSEALAKLSPEDPEAMPELPPQQFPTIPAWFDSTANLSPDDLALAVDHQAHLSLRDDDERNLSDAIAYVHTYASAHRDILSPSLVEWGVDD